MAVFVSFKFTNGNRVRFWEDMWYEELALKSQFLIIYGLERCKEPKVTDSMAN